MGLLTRVKSFLGNSRVDVHTRFELLREAVHGTGPQVLPSPVSQHPSGQIDRRGEKGQVVSGGANEWALEARKVDSGFGLPDEPKDISFEGLAPVVPAL